MGKKKRKFDYFDEFERQAQVAHKEASLLVDVVENFSSAAELSEALRMAHEIEHEGDQVNHEILNNVAIDFITPIDREDIIKLASNLDDVTDSIEEIMRRFYMYDIHFMHDDAREMAHLIRKSTKALENAMGEFRNFKKSKKVRELVLKVDDYEDQGDALYLEATRRLFTADRDDAVRIDVWSRIFDCMEQSCDQCEHVADAMGSIMLRNA